jgi:hypothetical protein
MYFVSKHVKGEHKEHPDRCSQGCQIKKKFKFTETVPTHKYGMSKKCVVKYIILNGIRIFSSI